MKKLISVLLITVFVFTFSSNTKAQFQIGAKAGLTLSQINSSNPALDTDDLKFKPGYEYGVLFNFTIVPMLLRVQPEIIYFQKGVTYKGDIAGINYTTKTTLNYLHIPINLRLKIPIIPIYVVAGPYFGYALSGKSYLDIGGVDADDDIEFGSDKTLPFDFGINTGVGILKGFGPIDFFVETRFSLGLVDMNGYSSDVTDKNLNIGINAGVLFGF